MNANRAAYVTAVQALRSEADALLSAERTAEEVARHLVARRNELKPLFRKSDPPELVALIEARNRARYGDPVGPGADWFFNKYGSWQGVMDAACRPADLSQEQGPNI